MLTIIELLRFQNRTQLLKESPCKVWSRLDNRNMAKLTIRVIYLLRTDI